MRIHNSGGADKHLRMLNLPFDSTCRIIEDCLDLYTSNNQVVGCDHPDCKTPTVRPVGAVNLGPRVEPPQEMVMYDLAAFIVWRSRLPFAERPVCNICQYSLWHVDLL